MTDHTTLARVLETPEAQDLDLNDEFDRARLITLVGRAGPPADAAHDIIDRAIASLRCNGTRTERVQWADELRAEADALWSASEPARVAERHAAWLRMWADVGAAYEHTIAMLHLGADWVEEHRRTVCAYCQEVHDVPSGAMAAHVRACAKNPLVAELASEREKLAAITALLTEHANACDDAMATIRRGRTPTAAMERRAGDAAQALVAWTRSNL